MLYVTQDLLALVIIIMLSSFAQCARRGLCCYFCGPRGELIGGGRLVLLRNHLRIETFVLFIAGKDADAHRHFKNLDVEEKVGARQLGSVGSGDLGGHGLDDIHLAQLVVQPDAWVHLELHGCRK